MTRKQNVELNELKNNQRKKINRSKRWFSEIITKIDKTVMATKEHNLLLLGTKVITTEATGIKKIIRNFLSVC